MRIHTHSLMSAAAALAIVTAAPVARAQNPSDRVVGNWIGVLPTGGMRMRLALTVTREPSGTLSAYMTSIDQGNARMPGTIAVRGDSVLVALPNARATYSAVLAGDSLRGTFSQGRDFPLALGHVAALPAVAHSQEPKPPFPYATEDVTIESVPGVRLAGTITMPPGTGPFPAVVLVTGSGPQNRDEELLGHKPFLVIADYLARHGIASLRYDDRGVAKSTGSFQASTSADFANDAEAAVKYLKTKPGIAHDHVGIMGHSEGGLIAPMVAARSRDVNFIVLLAGPGLPGDSILLLQQDLIARAQGAPAAMIDRNAEANTRLFAAIKAARDSADAVARVNSLAARMVASLPESQRAEASTLLEASKKELLSPWMMYFIKYDPRPALRQVHVPVLALGGSMDLQVPPKEDLSEIEAALKAAGNKDYRVVELPGLNHLFQPTKTGNPNEYASIDTTFSPDALALIADWINAHK